MTQIYVDQKEKKDDPIDVTIALTHQTLSEDDEYIRKVGEDKLDLILGGHEHQPFIGLVGDDEDVSKDAKKGVLCVKAGMDAENVVVVTIKRSKKKTGNKNNNNERDPEKRRSKRREPSSGKDTGRVPKKKKGTRPKN